MSSRVTLNVGFYFEKQHYAQLSAYIPRGEALSIPELNLEERERSNRQPEVLVNEVRGGRQAKSQSKKESDDEISEEEDIIPNDLEIDNEMDN